MKKKTLLFISLFLAGLAQAQTFTLTGTITGMTSGKLTLNYANKEGKQILDSSMIRNGHFEFRGNIANPSIAYLSVSAKVIARDNPNATMLYLDPAPMTIHLKHNDFKNAVITGSASQDEYATLEKLKAPIYKEMEPLSKAFEAAGQAYQKAVKEKKDDATVDTLKYRAAAIHDQFDPYFERAAQIDYAFFAAHPKSYVTASELRFHISSLSLDSAQMFYDGLGSAIQQSRSGKYIAEEIAKLRAGSPGSPAADFTAKELNGSTLTLSSLKGKYVLIDFWASWCVPCRKSMPHVKELYSHYKDKGLEVIAVSDDDGHADTWEKAVAKDSTGIWHNVLRGLDWEKMRKNEKNDKDISEKFGIHSLPTKILIDPNGMIIGRYDKGTEEEAAAMDKKIAEAFSKG
jgi:thiol-disulfide isomerase/thioredoxin